MTTLLEITDIIAGHIKSEAPRDDIELLPETNLLEEWIVDSLMILGIVTFVEEQFGIRFRRADINARTLESVQSLADYVQQRQADAG